MGFKKYVWFFLFELIPILIFFLLGLSVRDAERLVRNTGQKKIKNKTKTKDKPADTILLETDLSMALKMKVSINHEEGKEKGLISISYGSLDELDRISEVLLNSP